MQLCSSDDRFWNAVKNTIYMVLIAVPLNLLFSFLCAILLNLKVRGQSFYRVIFFLPSIVPAIAATMLWIWMLKPDNGILSTVLSWFGVRQPELVPEPIWAKPALILMGIWGIGGTIIIYLSGLQDVSQTLLESAELDGASWWQPAQKYHHSDGLAHHSFQPDHRGDFHVPVFLPGICLRTVC